MLSLIVMTLKLLLMINANFLRTCFSTADALRLSAILMLFGLLFSQSSAAQSLREYLESAAVPHADTFSLPTAAGVHRFTLISQTWRGHDWSHRFEIYVPRKVTRRDFAFIFVTGSGEPENERALIEQIAERAGVIAAVLCDVPNQPLYDGKKEDALLAFTFDQFLKSGDPSWPILFPMVKSVVRAMDLLEGGMQRAYAAKKVQFIVSGASKRGWTSWLTAAVDKRVAALAPAVFDMLNFKEQIRYAKEVYGAQSEKIRDYTELGLVERLDEPRSKQLLSWVDPYSYREALARPKLLLLGTNDPYWTGDSIRWYWDELPGPKWVFYAPNTGHRVLRDERARKVLADFVAMIAHANPAEPPQWSIKCAKGRASAKVLTTGESSLRATVWGSVSANGDFRESKWEVLCTADSGAECSWDLSTAGSNAAVLEIGGAPGLPLISTPMKIWREPGSCSSS